ncbi:nucleotidyltransferase domain-containing protein [Marinobacterium weihaiense]|uniref:Nucleotidyltransferase domain-containing protein n=1 Tax=Marinobacterium weihaiense TaxID=2851016 RepID=A0ABS6MCL4_9GAMM|nr:nucleotidyltransferase domain-containing protein [Marinobacterium weihaiense]MBV0934042.1 nucleotidyltransferase domain-containing protein [Marinobacterium weihaiense]
MSLKMPESATGLTAEQTGLLAECFDAFPAVEQVVLYGSRAKGNWHARSDVDHYDTLKNARLKDHIDRVGIVIYDRQQTHCGK